MLSENERLRMLIREVINSEKYISMEGEEFTNKEPGKEGKLNWMYFEEFGSRVLVRIGYTGDFDVLNEIKEELEQNSGWEFDQ
jgi:hypothetical protein